MILHCLPVGMLQCNCIVVADEDSRSAMIVDPGDEATRILKLVADQRYAVRSIINTHTHLDHVGANAPVQQSTGAELCVHADDLPLYEQLLHQWDWIGRIMPRPVRAEHTRHLIHGETLICGSLSFTVLHTPGHSPGSICLFSGAPEPVLLSGDTLFAGGIGRTDLPGGDEEQELGSIRMHLMTLPEATRVIPGHGGETTIAEELRHNPFLRS
jgi:glyoxylase-like metal-dependent hydrolase (beta-lactamase superfamily II)